METLIVGMAEYKISMGQDKIITFGLGSCCGIVLHDKISKISGMVHVVLPEPTLHSNENKAKFASTGIHELLYAMQRVGARKESMIAKMAGGAHMFGIPNSSSDILNIGDRNVEASKKALRELKIITVAEETGGKHGRTIEFDPVSGMLKVKDLCIGEHYI